MPDPIFISYARGDGEGFARVLHDRLEALRFPAWLDRRDIKPGENWDLAIDQGIRDSWGLLFVMSPSSVNSANCHDEWSRALSFKKPVLPLLVKACEPPLRLHRLQYVDFTSNFDKAFDQLIAHLNFMHSAAGELRVLQDRLHDLDHELEHTDRPDAVQTEMDSLKEQIAFKQRAMENPDEIAAENRHTTEEALNDERKRIQKAREKDLSMTRRRVTGSAPQGVSDLFRDRIAEQAAIINTLLVDEGDTRMVSIYGMGGAGKTALACRVMADLEKDHKSVYGLIYLSTRSAGISLESIYLDSARMLGGDAEETLNVAWADSGASTAAKIQRLLEHYGDHRSVILLDNMEDLLDTKGKIIDPDIREFVDAFLRQKHNTRLLITSREPLNVADNARRYEKIVPLDQGLPADHALELLKAFDREGQLGLADADPILLHTAVEKTHGYPRALEAIAGILAQDPFMSLASLLDNTDLFDEQVTIKLVHEAQSRLDADARRVMQALAVFARPVREAALRYLLEPFAAGLDIEATLRQLARGRYITVKRGSNELVLHPLDKDYSYRQIPRTADDEYTLTNLEHRAADYYAQLRLPADSWKSIRDFEPQLAEFDHLVRARDYDSAARLIDAIDASYLVPWGHARRVLNMREQLLNNISDPVLRQSNRGRLGVVYHTMGQIDEAIKYYEQALAIAREIDDRGGEATRLGHLGIAYSVKGQLDRAIEHYQQALTIAREIGDRRAEGRHLGNLGLAYRDLGQVLPAIRTYEEAIRIAREIGNRQGEGHQLTNLGSASLDLGQIESAVDHYQQALTIACEIGDRGLEELVLGNLSDAYYGLGEMDKAINSAGQALAIAREIDDRRGEGYWLGNQGKAYVYQGDLQHAVATLSESIAIAHEIHEPRIENHACALLARLYLHDNRYADALTAIQQARTIDIPETNATTAALHGLILARMDQPEPARAAFRQALTAANGILDKTPQYFVARYIQALATAALAVLTTDPTECATLAAAAQVVYREARANCAEPGIVTEAAVLLDELKAIDLSGVLA